MLLVVIIKSIMKLNTQIDNNLYGSNNNGY